MFHFVPRHLLFRGNELSEWEFPDCQDRPAAGSSRRGQLVLPAGAYLIVLRERGRASASRNLGLDAGFGALPGALLQVAVVQVSTVDVRHEVVPADDRGQSALQL